MGYVLIPLLWAACPADDHATPSGSYLYRPASSIDDDPRAPAGFAADLEGELGYDVDLRQHHARAGVACGGGVHPDAE